MALGLATHTSALRSSNQQVALAQAYDPTTGLYTDYYVSDDLTYTSSQTANQDWSVYSGSMIYEEEGCGYHLYEYDSEGMALSYYISDDTDYTSVYDWVTEAITEYDANYFSEYVNDDGTEGSSEYIDKDGVYYTGWTWSYSDEGYFNYYYDVDTSVEYYVDAMNYYTLTYDLLDGTID